MQQWRAADREDLLRMVRECIREGGSGCDLNHIDVSGITDFSAVFFQTDFQGDVSRWDVSQGTTFDAMFRNCPFDGDISRWRTGSATRLRGMPQVPFEWHLTHFMDAQWRVHAAGGFGVDDHYPLAFDAAA